MAKDIREMWEWLLFLQSLDENKFDNPEGFKQSIIKEKRKIRQEYLREEERKDPYKRIVHVDDSYGCDIWERIDCPEYITTKEEAEEFFNEYYRIPYERKPWDCTGQWFTYHHSVGKAGDRYVIAHLVAMDC